MHSRALYRHAQGETPKAFTPAGDKAQVACLLAHDLLPHGIIPTAPPGDTVTASPLHVLAHAQDIASAEPLDIIFIEGFTGQTVIGIHHDELHDTQPLRIDIAAGVPRPRACDTDRIGDTIDYSVVRTRLHRHLAQHRLQLLEAFAESVADILLDEFGAHWARVAVAKPRKFDDVEAVGVVIERRRRPEDRVAHKGAAVLSLIGAGHVPGKG